jgi:hypothetical protein
MNDPTRDFARSQGMKTTNLNRNQPVDWWGALILPIAAAIIALFVMMIGLPIALIRGFVFMKLWNWFVTGTITGFNMTWILASGICLTIGFVTAQTFNVKDERTQSQKWATVGMEFVAPFLTLFLGWILTLFL